MLELHSIEYLRLRLKRQETFRFHQLLVSQKATYHTRHSSGIRSLRCMIFNNSKPNHLQPKRIGSKLTRFQRVLKKPNHTIRSPTREDHSSHQEKGIDATNLWSQHADALHFQKKIFLFFVFSILTSGQFVFTSCQSRSDQRGNPLRRNKLSFLLLPTRFQPQDNSPPRSSSI